MPESATAEHITDRLRALSRPEAYPHRPETVTSLQTHISMLFFAGDRVYKVKKPVDMGFLDYTTLEKRRHFCEEEVRLNRRLAPKIYLGVVPIVRIENGRLLVNPADEAGEVVDYAVEMKRLPSDHMMSALLDHDAVDPGRLDELAQLLADFYTACPTGEGVDEHASPGALEEQMRENLAGLRPFADDNGAAASEGRAVLRAALIKHLESWGMMFLRDRQRLFEQRIRDERIREGHGDLHAGNICLLDDGIVIYDCIEFTPRFRCRDVAAELAFLAMDLDHRGRGDLADAFIDRFVSITGDRDLPRLLPFYKTHFAIVRAKVESLKSAEDEVDAEDRRAAAAEARRYLRLAAAYTVGPALIVTCGLPASGKSWFARQLGRDLGAQTLRSDVIRKELLGIHPTQRAEQTRPDAYSSEMNRRTYEQMRSRARDILACGRIVILDAMFSSRASREAARDLAADHRARLLLIYARAPEPTIRKRLAARRRDGSEVSDADLAVYEQARDLFEPPDEIPPEQRIDVTPETDPEDAIDRAIDRLIEQTT